MLLGRRSFLKSLAVAGAALVLPGEILPKAVGRSGQATSAVSEIIPAESPSLVIADTTDLDELAQRELRRRYWALGAMPADYGAVYIGGIRVGTIQSWSMTTESRPLSSRMLSHKIGLAGTFDPVPDIQAVPFSRDISVEMRASGMLYRADTILEVVESDGRQFTIQAEGYNVQAELVGDLARGSQGTRAAVDVPAGQHRRGPSNRW